MNLVGNGLSPFVYALAMNGTSVLYIGGSFTTTTMSFIGNSKISKIFQPKKNHIPKAGWDGTQYFALGDGNGLSTVHALAMNGTQHL